MELGAALWEEVATDLPGNVEIARVAVRLLVATALGGILGFQRAHVGKAAGMRTHILFTDSLSSCLAIEVRPISGDGAYSIGELGLLRR